MCFEAGEEGGKLKVDHAKTAIRLAIGDVAHVGVVMSDPEGFEFRKEFAGTLGIEVLNAGSAVGRDDPKSGRIRLQQSGYKIATAGLKELQDPHLVREPLGGVGAVIRLDHPAIEREMDRGAKRIFDFQHGRRLESKLAAGICRRAGKGMTV